MTLHGHSSVLLHPYIRTCRHAVLHGWRHGLRLHLRRSRRSPTGARAPPSVVHIRRGDGERVEWVRVWRKRSWSADAAPGDLSCNIIVLPLLRWELVWDEAHVRGMASLVDAEPRHHRGQTMVFTYITSLQRRWLAIGSSPSRMLSRARLTGRARTHWWELLEGGNGDANFFHQAAIRLRRAGLELNEHSFGGLEVLRLLRRINELAAKNFVNYGHAVNLVSENVGQHVVPRRVEQSADDC